MANSLDIQVVKAQSSHVPEIMDVWEEFSLFHQDIDPRYPMVDNVRVGFEEYLRGLMSAEDTLVLVALDKDKVVGFSVARISNSNPGFKRKKYGAIDVMAVSAKCRRRGIGTAILDKVLDWFKSQKMDMIELSVASGNKVGYPFWKKHGFKAYLHRLYLKPSE
jgi:ribosomal protein S18 acetylase RimI-like enzyme